MNEKEIRKAIASDPELRKIFEDAAKRRKEFGLPDPRDYPPEVVEMFRRAYAYLRKLRDDGML